MDDYGRCVILDLSFDQAVIVTTSRFEADNFEVVARFDLREFLARKLHHDCRRYLLLEILNPELALEALQHDASVGAALATTVAIYELPDGETAVTVSPTLAPVIGDLGWRAARPALAAIGDRAATRIACVLDGLQEESGRKTQPRETTPAR